jgi:hypothetical protein
MPNVNLPLRRMFIDRESWSWSMWHVIFAPKGQCGVMGCSWHKGWNECPEHGIGAYYERCAREGRDSGD